MLVETTTSSVFEEAEWDKGNLTVYFRNYTVYLYRQVPEKLWNHMRKAASTGSFYNTYIKGVYQFTRLY